MNQEMTEIVRFHELMELYYIHNGNDGNPRDISLYARSASAHALPAAVSGFSLAQR